MILVRVLRLIERVCTVLRQVCDGSEILVEEIDPRELRRQKEEDSERRAKMLQQQVRRIGP